MPKTKAPPFITLTLDTGAQPFSGLQELHTWLNQERKAFEWISEYTVMPGVYGYWGILTQWHYDIEAFIKKYSSADDVETRKNLVDKLKNTTSRAVEEGLITSKSPIAEFVLSLRQNRPDHVAVHALNILSEKDEDENIHAQEGAYWAFQYLQGNTEAVEAHKKGLDSLKE